VKSVMLKNDWPEWRMRFLLHKKLSSEQNEKLHHAEQVSFVPMEAVGENGGIDTDTIHNKSDVEKGYTLFFDRDVIVAKITPCFENGKGALAKNLYEGIGYGTTELYVLSPQEKLDESFLFYLTISHPFRIQGEASMKGAAGQKRVPDEFIQNFRFQLPPIKIQQEIASYLDTETAQIDTLISEKEQMLKLLEEKRSALVSHAVTRGIETNVLTKPSGLEWLGEIPIHWKIHRGATLFTETDERNEPDLPLLNVSLNTGVTIRTFSDDRIESVAADFATYKVARKGNLVFNKMRFWQGAAGIAPEDGLTSPDYTVAKISEAFYPEYVALLVRIPRFSNEVRRYSYGMVDDRLRLYWDGFKNIRFPIPPLKEQKAIVSAIKQESKQTAEMESNLKQSIDLLKERRSALITAAVTGQLDIETLHA